MNVSLIAQTHTAIDFWSICDDLGFEPVEGTGTESLIEFAGRCCYQSWSKPNPETFETPAYVRSLIDKKHFSVLEHASATFFLEGVSRSFTHELVRHRHLSFSQVSQRYVTPSGSAVLSPAAEQDAGVAQIVQDAYDASYASYDAVLRRLRAKGVIGKQAREAARAVLPNCESVSIVVSGNLRAWYELLEKRLSPLADAEFQGVAAEIKRLLEPLAPAVFGA